MNIARHRKATAAILVSLAALGLSACHPPHQVDSDHKVDTATSQDPNSLANAGETTGATATNVAQATAPQRAAAGQRPVYIDCGQPVGAEPARLSLSCSERNDFIEDITWTQWDGMLATGTGTRITVNPDRRTPDSQIILGNPVEVDGQLQFTTVSIDGVEVNPNSQYQ